jgi:hypothetical protein
MFALALWADYLEYQNQGDCIGRLVSLGVERSNITLLDGGGCIIKVTN